MKTCKICEKKFIRLSPHVIRSHNIDYSSYLLDYEYGGLNPKCECGCGFDVPFSRSHGMRFLKYIVGHTGRIKGRLTEESKKRIGEKNRQNLKKMHENNPDLRIIKNRQLISGITPEIRSRSAKTNSQNWKKTESQEKRKKQTDRAIDLLEKGKIGPQAPYRAEWKMNVFTGNKEYMHSSWETRFLDECVSRNIPVTKQHGIKIAYTDQDNIEHVYIPDFLSLDGKVLYEIKGYETETDKKKRQAMIQWCIDNHVAYEIISFRRTAST